MIQNTSYIKTDRNGLTELFLDWFPLSPENYHRAYIVEYLHEGRRNYVGFIKVEQVVKLLKDLRDQYQNVGIWYPDWDDMHIIIDISKPF